MDKKTRNILIVVLVVVVAGGLFYGIQRYRQQMAVSNFLKAMGISGSQQAQDLAKQLANQNIANVAQQVAQNAASESAANPQTPDAVYAAATDVAPYDDATRAISDNTKWLMDGVFGKEKATTYSTIGGGNYVMYTVPRATAAADLGEFAKLLSGKGYQTISSGVSGTEAALTMNKAGTGMYIVAYTVGEQIVTITYTSQSAQ